MRDIMRYYTREAGVRSLEREISKICRKVVKGLAAQEVHRRRWSSTTNNLNDFLGCAQVQLRSGEKQNQVGQVVGLAWTEVGGDLLTIEAALMPGKGNIIRTGSLGDVMKESVEAARTVVRSRAAAPGHQGRDCSRSATSTSTCPTARRPRTGPSAGAAMTTAFVSALTGIPVRADVAMTGEITLRGEGHRDRRPEGETAGGALRGGIKTVMIPEENAKDLQDIPENVKNHLEIVPVRWIDKVLEIALELRCRNPCPRRSLREGPKRPSKAPEVHRCRHQPPGQASPGEALSAAHSAGVDGDSRQQRPLAMQQTPSAIESVFRMNFGLAYQQQC